MKRKTKVQKNRMEELAESTNVIYKTLWNKLSVVEFRGSRRTHFPSEQWDIPPPPRRFEILCVQWSKSAIFPWNCKMSHPGSHINPPPPPENSAWIQRWISCIFHFINLICLLPLTQIHKLLLFFRCFFRSSI